MEPQLSVLLYSKYSSLSKTLMDMIQSSGVDFVNKFALQSLCIDNEEIRKRIIQNTQIHVTTVPCLLIIFPDGGIEKYDGTHIFEWVEGVIRQFAPPPPPPVQQQRPPQPTEEENWRRQQAMEQQKIQEQKMAKERERERIREENKRNYEKQYEEGYDQTDQKPAPRRRRRVKNSEPSPGVTSIDELPSDEDDEHSGDRFRTRKPIGRIRSGEGNYEEDDDLFQGDPVNTRTAVKSAIKGTSHTGNDATSQKSADIMAKAKELAKGREEPRPPPGHPMNQTN